MAPRIRRLDRPSANKFDPAEQYRAEIEERTAAGETCEQIAAALRAQGTPITNKTISRRRVQWGLRQRPPHKYAGMKHPKARPKSGARNANEQSARKEDIAARTQRGETAEQIADALTAQGVQLKRGSSTILRLQTYWGLIPFDDDRARGRHATKKRGDRKEVREVQKASQREREKEANRAQRSGNLHYPADCSFGPKKRANGELDDGEEFDDEGDDGAFSPDAGFVGSVGEVFGEPQPNDVAQPMQDRVSVAAEIMSVDFLVDLATSTLGAANNLKAMLLAYQTRVPAAGSTTGLPPTLEDLLTARRKVREAAAVMHDLAVDPAGE
ncbi:uncharacterized protein LTR77_003704 [Saxophila tyrrhenica]|uniref:Uncharacterized protein n=1 Tax=Saxophila tyrrhenica TaxID=1690608 RepID=A0AAV9PIM1_9PEZI|nr:hypothetical protein LTR77_003704 [Saxophila tyrrhenica]